MIRIPAGIEGGGEALVVWSGLVDWDGLGGWWRRQLLAGLSVARLVLLALDRIPAGTRVVEAAAGIHSWTLGGRWLLLLLRPSAGELPRRWRLEFRTVGSLRRYWRLPESSESSQSLNSGFQLKWEGSQD